MKAGKSEWIAALEFVLGILIGWKNAEISVDLRDVGRLIGSSFKPHCKDMFDANALVAGIKDGLGVVESDSGRMGDGN